MFKADVFLVDNGSDIAPKARNTTHRIKENAQTTGGWLYGLDMARGSRNYFAYWFLITSAEFVFGDPLAPMVDYLFYVQDAVGIHPALTPDSTTSWEHMKTRGLGLPRQTWMIDNIASLYRAEWLDKHSFDSEMVYGWGIDLETCYQARMGKRSLWIDERCRVKKVTDIGYTMNRMNMSAEERRQRAGANMREVLARKYGPDYWHKMTEWGVTDAMR